MDLPEKYNKPSSALGAWQQKLNKHNKKGLLNRLLPLPPEASHSTNKHLYILLDTSSSMENNLNFAKKGAIEFVDIATKKGYNVGLISFDYSAKLKAKASTNVKAIKQRIKYLTTEGSTDMTGALSIAYTQLKKINGTRVVWVVTDGYPDESHSALREGTKINARGIDIICLGTEDADHVFLKKLASRKELAAETKSNNLSKAMKSTALQLPGSGSILRLEDNT